MRDDWETLQLSPSQRSNKNLFLIAAEVHGLHRRCERFIIRKIVDEEGNITQQTEIIVKPMKKSLDTNHIYEKRDRSLTWLMMSLRLNGILF